MMKKLFNWTNISGTFAVFLFMWMLGSIGVQFDFLNVFEEVLSDYNLTDVYYTKIRNNEAIPFDERIVLVNIGDASRGRGSIADEISILNKYNPKVIAIDAKFFGLKEDDPMGDFKLATAIQEANNFIMASEFAVTSDTSTGWDTLYTPPPLFSQNAQTAFVNVGNLEFGDFTTWRTIPVKETTKKGKKEPCFPVKIAEVYNEKAAQKFLARGNEIENIYFKGNLDKFTKLDVDDVLKENFIPELIKDKIVIMGYMGDHYTDYYFDEDKFYTPLNEKQVGRGTPDMFGVVVHANVVSMILDENYINEMPAYIGYIIAIILCYLNVALFAYILDNKKLSPYYGLTKIIQLIEVLIILTISIFSFALFNYKVDLTLVFLVIILAGDLTEIYIDIILVSLSKISFIRKLSLKPNSLNAS
ncbi:CHASE2 domain-containing protein [Chondrinema litorale]|uniref:CHASE2 domain-containing protein n=1 Tax=Chondrinema litorale TaxID=2994555 RepID=UPI0025431FF3|nr:CHASE2 domain-containing protein [Chondrinema litorale]UZR92369.1 CHASE2 domain-containing protein [Chondrinema litorale]